ncbi:alpha/beta fold hydrolase [Propionibacteriaceae bacterium Y2011]
MTLIPPGSTTTHVTVDGNELRVLTSTATPAHDRTPLLLVHGGGSDNAAISWYEMFEAFGEDRTVIAPDLPGFGGSIDVTPVGGADQMADVVAAVAAELDISTATVVGVSMGGEVALQLALRHPELVAGVVAIAPGGLVGVFRNKPAQFGAWLAAHLPDVLLRPLARVANRYVDRALRAMVKDPATLPEEVVAEFVAESQLPDAGMAYGRYNQASLGPLSMRNNLLPVVERITVPALFFHGADDPLVPPEGSREAARRMPDAELVLVPDCGHWAQLEAGERFRTELRRFLVRLDT